MAKDHLSIVERLAEEILSRERRVDRGMFPMAFTSLNDLSLAYLLRRLTDQQQRDIRALEQAVESLGHDARAQALAEDALGAAVGHLDNLREVQRDR
jgi:hypothetical protein